SYSKIPSTLRQKLLYANNVTAFLQATPLGAMVFSEEQAFLQNGRLDDAGTMWCYRPDRIGFSVILKQPAYVSHLVIYLNNAIPEQSYRYITIQANDLQKKSPRTMAFVRGNHRRFIVIHFPETFFTDSLKILPGKTRARFDSMTEIEVYGPVGGPEMLAGKKLPDDPLAIPMFMGNAAHVPAVLPEDFIGEFTEVPLRDIHYPPVYGAGITIADNLLTFPMAVGRIDGLPLKDARPNNVARGWQPGSVTPLSTPARYASRLLVGSADYKMHAIADNGTRIWSFKTGGRVYSSPIPHGDEVYFGSDDGTLYKVDVDSGILIWEFKTLDRIRSSPAIDGKNVYFASWDGFIYAVNITSGMPAWKTPIAQFTRSSPAVHDGRVYIGDENGAVHCINASNGQPLWKAEIGGRISMCPLITPDGVFAAADDGTGALIGLDGSIKWKRDLLGSLRSAGGPPPRLTGQPFATKTQVFITSNSGVVMINRQSGERDARFVPPSSGGNCTWAAPYGNSLCLVVSHARFNGSVSRFVIEHGGGVRMWQPK
ncbi:MAG TPA: PQQ-binding-like beta-propeller repeat protein, partial [Planctomycetota bacterium]|nr:PQQ-binding-like beta-propeller repeat protein [Planctomycetota bacterium]